MGGRAVCTNGTSAGFRGFNMSATGPARDHAAGDVATMKYLAAEAQKKRGGYRKKMPDGSHKIVPIKSF